MKTTFDIVVKAKKEGKSMPTGKAMIKGGYSTNTAKNPQLMTKTKGWNELLAKYDDEPVMDLVYADAKDKKDKRNALQNRRLYFDLKGRIKQNININEYNKELKSLVDGQED